MLGQIRFMRELFVAADAGVVPHRRRRRRRTGSVSGVRLHVRPQIGSIGERLTAMSTSVGLLSRVGPEMPLKEPWPGEGLVADVAFVAEFVGEEMHGERRHGNVDFVAVRALPRPFRVEVAVSLFVTGEIGRCCVRFAAFVARVSLLLLLL